MKRVYIIALVGALFVFGTAMFLKSPMMIGSMEGNTDSGVAINNVKETKLAEAPKSAPASVKGNTAMTEKLATGKSAMTDADAKTIVSDATADDVDINSESNDSVAVSTDLQNYDQVKNSSYDNSF